MKNGKKSMEDRGWKRATYFLDQNLVKTFNKLAAILEKDKSEFANEALTNTISENAVLLNKIGVEITPTENNAGEQMNKKLAKSDVNKIQSTFHLNEDIKESLKRLAGLNPDGKDLSSLANEALYDLFVKYQVVFKRHGIPLPNKPIGEVLDLQSEGSENEVKIELRKKGSHLGWDKVSPTFGRKLLAFIMTQADNYTKWAKDNGFDPKEIYELINSMKVNMPLITQKKFADLGCDMNWFIGDVKNIVEIFDNKQQLNRFLVRTFQLKLDDECDRVILQNLFDLYDKLKEENNLLSYMHEAFDIYKSYFSTEES